MWRSLPQMPQRSTLTRISPAAGDGSGTVSTVRGSPTLRKTAAFTSGADQRSRPLGHALGAQAVERVKLRRGGDLEVPVRQAVDGEGGS